MHFTDEVKGSKALVSKFLDVASGSFESCFAHFQQMFQSKVGKPWDQRLERYTVYDDPRAGFESFKYIPPKPPMPTGLLPRGYVRPECREEAAGVWNAEHAGVIEDNEDEVALTQSYDEENVKSSDEVDVNVDAGSEVSDSDSLESLAVPDYGAVLESRTAMDQLSLLNVIGHTSGLARSNEHIQSMSRGDAIDHASSTAGINGAAQSMRRGEVIDRSSSPDEPPGHTQNPRRSVATLLTSRAAVLRSSNIQNKVKLVHKPMSPDSSSSSTYQTQRLPDPVSKKRPALEELATPPGKRSKQAPQYINLDDSPVPVPTPRQRPNIQHSKNKPTAERFQAVQYPVAAPPVEDSPHHTSPRENAAVQVSPQPPKAFKTASLDQGSFQISAHPPNAFNKVAVNGTNFAVSRPSAPGRWDNAKEKKEIIEID